METAATDTAANPSPDPGDWPATEVFFRNLESKQTVVVNVGGARSSKSYSILQLFITRFLAERGKTFLTARKTFPSLRITTYKQAIDMLIERKIYHLLDHNKSEKVIRNPYTGNYWLFSSIDNPEKIKSTEFNYIHAEEANEFSYEDYRILKLRLSGKAAPDERNQIFLSLNPSDDQGWIRTRLIPSEPHEWIHSTYRDNPFLPKSYIEELESLQSQDDTYWQIYGLGEWAQFTELIYGSPHLLKVYPSEMDEIIYGLDFGYNNPSALLRIGIKDMGLYFDEIIYQRKLTNSELIDLMKQKMTPYEMKTRPIYADSAEPDRIREIQEAGFNIIGAKKNVKDGIDLLKRYHHYSKEENVNFNKEWSRYKWRKDRNENILDEPVKFEDHFPDAGRMAVYSHLGGSETGAFIGFTAADVY